jgi:membrane protease YdiL (CAAX protease family)
MGKMNGKTDITGTKAAGSNREKSGFLRSDAGRLIVYLFFAFGGAFAWFAIANPGHLLWNDMTSEWQSFVSLGMLFPAIAHILTRRVTGEGFRLTGEDSMMLGISFRNRKWILYLVAVFLPWFYCELGAALTILMHPEAYDPQHYLTEGVSPEMLKILPAACIVSGMLGSFAAFGEEAGWRGYMMPKLRKLMGKYPALIVGGIIWGLWHAPLTVIGHNFGTDYPGFPYVGVLKMCFFCIVMGTLLTFVTEVSGSIWPAAILHAVNNTNPCILNGFVDYDKVPAGSGLSGESLAVLLTAAVVLVVWRKPERK